MQVGKTILVESNWLVGDAGSQGFSTRGEHNTRTFALVRRPEFHLFPLLGMSILEDEMTSPGPGLFRASAY